MFYVLVVMVLEQLQVNDYGLVQMSSLGTTTSVRLIKPKLAKVVTQVLIKCKHV